MVTHALHAAELIIQYGKWGCKDKLIRNEERVQNSILRCHKGQDWMPDDTHKVKRRKGRERWKLSAQCVTLSYFSTSVTHPTSSQNVRDGLCNNIQYCTMQAFTNQYYTCSIWTMNYPASHADCYYNITGKLPHLKDSCYQVQLASRGIIMLINSNSYKMQYGL